MKTTSTRPEEHSLRKAALPSPARSASGRRAGRKGRRRKRLRRGRMCREDTHRPTTGAMPVARAAPKMPISMG